MKAYLIESKGSMVARVSITLPRSIGGARRHYNGYDTVFS